MNWKDVVKELDHPGFMLRDRPGFVLLITGLRRALPTDQYIELLYGRWMNVEGQVSERSTRKQEDDRSHLSSCLGSLKPFVIPMSSVWAIILFIPCPSIVSNIPWMKRKKRGHGKNPSSAVGVCLYLSPVIRRSLKLIECLLRIADAGFYPIVLDIFKHGSQRAGEVIFLGLLQVPVSLENARCSNRMNDLFASFQTAWTTLKQELFQLIIPTSILNSPNANGLLNVMWNSPVMRRSFVLVLSRNDSFV